jgi:hypothetical protein
MRKKEAPGRPADAKGGVGSEGFLREKFAWEIL